MVLEISRFQHLSSWFALILKCAVTQTTLVRSYSCFCFCIDHLSFPISLLSFSILVVRFEIDGDSSGCCNNDILVLRLCLPSRDKHLRRIYTWFRRNEHEKTNSSSFLCVSHHYVSEWIQRVNNMGASLLQHISSYGPDWRFSFPLAGESPTASLDEVPPEAGASREVSPVPVDDLELPPAEGTYMTPAPGP